jgi:hypothetical protein
MENDELMAKLRYWQSRPAWERLAAVTELTTADYRQKHGGADPPPFNKPAVRIAPFPDDLNDPRP